MSQAPPQEDDATRIGRFEIRRKLGSGGTGVIYLAWDRQRGAEVALKVLRQVTGPGLYRFKREFRGLADIVHPNLVTLHELHNAADSWFISMEYVDGESFIDWVRPKRESARPRVASAHDAAGEVTGPTQVDVLPGAAAERPLLRRDRLDEALYQLVDGVYALHQAGKLHRDLKPSNVRVDRRGRVVLLDFGLSSDVAALNGELTHSEAAVGTPLYMSPEQAGDEPLSPASDWYAVGVMLYEALTGARPFTGPPGDVLRRKRAEDPVPPGDVAPDAPADLAHLAQALLSRDPRRRPDGGTILAALGRAPSTATLQLAVSQGTPFVGRARELGALRQALDDTRAGRAVAILLRGDSGMGKSALARRFLEDVAGDDHAVVLEGRCWERESVPYKALDTIVDALTAFLLRQSEPDVEALLPRDIQAVARLFPVLRRVPAIGDPALVWVAPPDPQELRRRAVSGLRRLLRRIADTQPLVVYVDDAQWSDVDGAAFLTELFHHPEPPAMLLVASCRTEDEQSPLVHALGARRAPGAASEVRDLVLGRLAAEEAAELVAGLRPAAASPAELVELYAESGGNPFFLGELARARQDDGARAGMTLDELLSERIARLPEDARRLLEASVVAGRPMAVDVLLRAAGLSGEGTAVVTLGRERLLRAHGRDAARRVVPWHDRVRESTMALLTPALQRDLHLRLAESLEAAGSGDAEALARHFLAAGEPARAARWLVGAARGAEDALAFHRAAALYRQALEVPSPGVAQRLELMVRLGHALANAGRLDEAAAAFGDAALAADGTERLELERLQLEQVLRRGRLEEGLALSRKVLSGVGLRLPSSHLQAMLYVVASRAWLRVRGMGFRERREADVPPDELRRLDVSWSASSGLSFVDPILGKSLQMRYLREALATGEPQRMVMALTLELGYVSIPGAKAWKRAEAIAARGFALAERLEAPHLRGLLLTASGLAAYLSGRWKDALARFTEGDRLMRDHTVGFRWELDLAEIFRAALLLILGDIRELQHVLPRLVRDAEERGDVYALRGLCGWRANQAWLLWGRPDEARERLATVALPPGPRDAFHLHHYYELLARCQIDLYAGRPEAAWRRVCDDWRPLERSMLPRLQIVRIEAQHLRGRTALAAAAGRREGERAPLLQAAAAMARRIEGDRVGYAQALALLLQAGLAGVRGDADALRAHLGAAAEAFDAADMALHAAVARRALGRLVGGAVGAQLAEAAEGWMRGQGIADPATVSRLYAPGVER